MLALLAEPFVRVLLGEQWLEAATLVPLLCIGIAMEALAPIVTPFLSATGSVRVVLPIALQGRTAQIAIVACLANFSITWVAAGQIVLGCITFFVNTRYLRRCAGIRVMDLAKAARPSVLVAGLTVIIPLIVLTRPGIHGASPWLSLGLGGGLAGVCWIGAIIGLKHPLSDELVGISREMLRIIRGLV
jgi:O-antigen/teichoic acid export membrane protein